LTDIPLVYVYLDNKLPRYALYSLKLARRQFDGPIILLTNRDDTPAVDGVEIIDIRDWYRNEIFLRFRKDSRLDGLFRGGFWLKAVERFFVLHEFMTVFSVSRLMHAELDVLILDLQGLPEDCDSSGKGIFIPLQQVHRAYASLIYINQVSALGRTLRFFEHNSSLGNEMRMLAAFLASEPDVAHSLPSESSLTEEWPLSPSWVPSSDWLIDCSGFGFWVFGYDPRNLPGTVWNHFGESSSGTHFRETSLQSNFAGTEVTVRDWFGRDLKIRAIHVHSKIFSRLRIPGLIWLYVLLSNLPFRIPILVRSGSVKATVLTKFCSRTSNNVVSRVHPTLRYLFSSVVRSLVASSPKILSERERRVANLFFSPKPFGELKNPPVPVFRPTSDLTETVMVFLGDKLDRFSEEFRDSLRLEIQILLSSLESSGPRLYLRKAEFEMKPRTLIRDSRQLLFVSDRKRYSDSIHALAYWADLPLNNRFSFATDAQVLIPEIVREMFPRGEKDIVRWATMGIDREEPSLSAFQSYGTWLYSMKRDGYRLAAVDN